MTTERYKLGYEQAFEKVGLSLRFIRNALKKRIQPHRRSLYDNFFTDVVPKDSLAMKYLDMGRQTRKLRDRLGHGGAALRNPRSYPNIENLEEIAGPALPHISDLLDQRFEMPKSEWKAGVNRLINEKLLNSPSFSSRVRRLNPEFKDILVEKSPVGLRQELRPISNQERRIRNLMMAVKKGPLY